MYWLYAYDPTTKECLSHKGDSGGMSMVIWLEDNTLKHEHNARPRVGAAIRVGSISARSYSVQDWWQTSTIQEILEEYENDNTLNIKFRTQNSYYHWKHHY